MRRHHSLYSPLQTGAGLTVQTCVILGLAVFLIATAGCAPQNRVSDRVRARKREATHHRLPPIRQAQFRNTGADAKYVGSEACIECHAGEHDSYLHTTHSRALSRVDVDQQPPDAELTHELSGRSYRIYREDGQLRHREFLKSPDGTELVLSDHPMMYAIGSGNHSRSYLLEIDGFLFESPLTWYTSRGSWDLSPGYVDDPLHPGFSRAAMRDCVICHVGQVEPVDRSLHKLKITEMAIGCERCHGPGSLHVARRQSDLDFSDDFDDTIVHPARLPRELQEAICAQCHLASVAEADVRGRSLSDFRPSLYLSDFRVRFRSQTQDDSMTVVGHIEQMRSSRCYQMSPKMTCTTCHNMHASSGDAGPAPAGRSSCLSCHTTEACGLELVERLKRTAEDNCITCHMPKSATDIPHFAFRHHRVGIHEEPPANINTADKPPAKGFGKLIPIDDLSHLPKIEQKRCLGLAYVKFAEEGDLANPTLYYETALTLLEEVRASGLQDAEVDAVLARVYLRGGNKILATDRGQSALLNQGLSDEKRRDAVGALSRVYMNEKAFQLAEPLLNQLIRFRYNAEDHLMLSICRHHAGDLAGSLRAAQAAVNIEPDRPDLHDAVSQLYFLSRNEEQGKWHQQRSKQLHDLLKVVVGDEATETEPR